MAPSPSFLLNSSFYNSERARSISRGKGSGRKNEPTGKTEFSRQLEMIWQVGRLICTSLGEGEMKENRSKTGSGLAQRKHIVRGEERALG